MKLNATSLYSRSSRLQELIHNVNDIHCSSPFIQGMACCHSLTRIHGNLTGDPLDFKMFQSTGWVSQILMSSFIVMFHYFTSALRNREKTSHDLTL